MIVFTRKPRECIRIGDDITITVVRVEPGRCKIGVETPPHIPVHRQEVYERIQENRRLSCTTPNTPKP